MRLPITHLEKGGESELAAALRGRARSSTRKTNAQPICGELSSRATRM
jgi:hypothetical protein